MVGDGSPATAAGLHAQDNHRGDVCSVNGSSGGGGRLGAALHGSLLLAGSPLNSFTSAIAPASANIGGGTGSGYGSLSSSFGALPGNTMPDLPGACA